MLRINIGSLKPGVKLGKDIFTSNAQLLLPAGTVISNEHLQSFKSRNITEVFIMEASPKLKSEKKFDDVYSDSLTVVKSFMLEAKLGKPLEMDEISDTTNLLLEQVFDAGDLFRQMRLMKDKDDYLFTHSVNVALLCILIGRWLNYDKETIKELGEAGLVHDIGKVFIPDHVLNKPGKLTNDEYEEMKKHTVMGYNLLIQSEAVSNNIATAALMHHERADGSGYPMGKKGYDIGLCSSVVAVADVYDAVTSTRVYSTKRSPYIAAEILWEESFGKLDPRISKVFYDKVTNFYVGNEVLLSNNERGLVIYVDPTQPTRPVVKVGEKFYDLNKDRSLTVMEIID
ncbi:HD-GYP domain-containing protein [Syntrophomonas palmitatica]|uniref:HD-GYP domain-containing protein n=1 Tax=Syntrophomonas palmitatica TaxID=402877 RepID=UPI0006D00272|nr:HD-GYP domain-containing protein [Syntrophomonas palmitatica]